MSPGKGKLRGMPRSLPIQISTSGIIGIEKSGVQHADDGVWTSFEGQFRPTALVGVAEQPLGKPVGEHCDGVGARRVVRGQQRAAHRSLHPEGGEERARGARGPQPFGLAAAGEVGGKAVERGQRRERSRVSRPSPGSWPAPPSASGCRRWSPTATTSRSASGNGSGRSTTAFSTEKMAVLAPMPSAERHDGRQASIGWRIQSRKEWAMAVGRGTRDRRSGVRWRTPGVRSQTRRASDRPKHAVIGTCALWKATFVPPREHSSQRTCCTCRTGPRPARRSARSRSASGRPLLPVVLPAPGSRDRSGPAPAACGCAGRSRRPRPDR